MAIILVVDYDMSLAIGVQLTLRQGCLKFEIGRAAFVDRDAIDAAGADVAMIDTAMSGVDILHASRAIQRSVPGIPLVASSSAGFRRNGSTPRWRPSMLAVTLLVSVS
jgi:DNA-binding NtrC family response regulator